MPRRSSQLPGLLVLALLAAGGSTAAAQEPLTPEQSIEDDSPTRAKPKELEGVGLEERLGERINLDLAFRDENGADVTLRELFDGDLPVVLTLNYADCPMLCDLMLGGLTKTMLDIPETKGVPDFAPGRQFRIVTVSLNPKETTKRMAQMKAGYVERFPEDRQGDIAHGWRFVTGDEAQIKELAHSLGFGYRYLPSQNDYLHPSVIMMLSRDGMIIRYLKGIEYKPADFTDSIIAAGTSSPQASIGFLYSCFHWDSKANDYSNFGRRLMMYVGSAFAFLLLAAIGTWHVFRARKSRIGV